MAITSAIMQMRRGLEADFDPDKMKPGEWAVSLDKKYVRMCFSPGVCVRMATYEAFEADMVKIQKILEECQTIEEAVKQIQLEIDAKEIAIEKYVQEAKAYSETASDEADRATLEADRAKTEADRASSIANIGIATTEKAGIVKPDGETIRVDADGTIHADNGTVDYNELENKPQINGVELSGNKSLSDLGIASDADLQEVETKVDTIIEKAELNIKNTASGENIHLTDSANGKNVEFVLYGKATQDGEPTPDNPIDIVVSGESYNLLENTGVSRTDAGITFTINNKNGSVTANGTTTSSPASISINNNIATKLIIGEKYILSGGDKSKNCYVKVVLENGTTFIEDDGSNVTFTYNGEKIAYVALMVRVVGTTVNNFTFYPMIRKASVKSSRYVPYGKGSVEVVSENEDLTQSTNAIIPTPDGLAGIKVSSGGNYVDENGQMWVCDEIVKYADGSGKRVQRIHKIVFKGTESFGLTTATTGGGYYFTYTNAHIKSQNNDKASPIVLCNKLKAYASGMIWAHDLTGVSIGSKNSVRFRFTILGITTVAELQAKLKEWYDAGDPLVVYAEKATPIETPLTAEEIAEIEKLHTFYPVTNISNDADCGMSIKYLCDSKNYIDNRLAQIEAVLINNI